MLSAIICADWSKNSTRRAAYVADVPTRLVKCLGRGPFTLLSLVNAAAAYSAEGSVLLGIDAPLGAPRSLVAATHRDLGLPPTATFVEWVTKAAAWPNFFSRAAEGEPWSPLRPFFRVAPGADGRDRMFRAMRERGVEALRDVDKVTAAKSLFIISGIPGSVGSSVVDLWPALSGMLANRPRPRCWPFDQAEPETGAAGVVLAEIYPRALYASALASEPPPLRARMSIAKGERECRRAAIDCLRAHDWVRKNGVRFEDVEPETITEDSFDALLSAAGALRCVLDGTPLGWSGSDPFEGGILGLDSLNLSLPERTFRCGSNQDRQPRRRSSRRPKISDRGSDSPFLQRPVVDWVASNDLAFAIPDPFPVSPGHTLVVTKRLIPTWFEATRYEQLAVVDLIEEVKRLLDRRTPAPDGYNVGFNAGAAAGQTVMHVHVHVIPRYAGDVLDPTGGIRNVIRRTERKE